MYAKVKRLEKMFVFAVEVIIVIISLVIAYLIRYGVILGVDSFFDQNWLLFLMLGVYISLFFAHDWNYKMFRRGYFAELRSIVLQEATFVGIVLVILFMIHNSHDVSRLILGYYFVIGTILTWISHLLIKAYLLKIHKTGKYSNRMILILSPSNVDEITDGIIKYKEWNRKIVGILLTDSKGNNASSECEKDAIDGIPIIRDFNEPIEYVMREEVDEVFIWNMELKDTDTLVNWVATMQNMGVIVNVRISSFDLVETGKRNLGRVGKYSTAEYTRNVFSYRQILVKKILDYVGALTGLMLTAIMFPIVAIAIKADSKGPVIFKQTRVGKNGRTFMLYKFRTMVADAEEQKEGLLEQNEVEGPMFKMKFDPRITKVGKFLRKSSLDEFPQFINVLKGDMSLVGTRPPTVNEYQNYTPEQKCRMCITPGITGMWQVSGRSQISDFDEIVRLDMEYIDGWTIWRDIKILLKTVVVVLLGRGAI
jgi:exopolysaccharide biosynthesis polyprenyl glycosylphosphotransferase